MSHFKLFVVGDDIESLMAPFYEGCEIEFCDKTSEVMEKWESDVEGNTKEYGDIAGLADSYFGYKVHDGKYGYFYNPQAKWDWWQKGGRYGEYLVRTDGAVGNSFKVKDIDFTAMEHRNASNAAQWWDEAHQEKNAAMKELMYGIKPGMTKEQYIAKRTGVSAYAFLMGENWVQRGEMGWFGISTGEKDPEDWDAEITAFIKGLDPEQTLTVVDCHI